MKDTRCSQFRGIPVYPQTYILPCQPRLLATQLGSAKEMYQAMALWKSSCYNKAFKLVIVQEFR